MKKNIKKVIILIKKSPCIKCMGFFAFLLFFNSVAIGQINHFDSIKSAFQAKPKFIFKLDSKFSFVSSQLVSMRGVKVGANFNEMVKVGVGYSWMKNNFRFDNPTQIVNDSTYDLRYSYVSLFGDYKFYSKKKLSLLINSDFAILKLGYKNKQTKSYDFLSYGLVIEPSVISEYRFFNYFILGTGLGYRFIFREEKQVSEKFSAPIFIMRFKIDLQLLYNKYLKK